ncbi:Hypothetical protein SMAX5B_013907 [Scophthalmus maximus]|uniref:Uncharacterized protein n=1 Tax=Scophthalmus maximus TaxID=52904 RepID=A0A2U9CFU9_SCOMX|nr:Hypothetical protein SMAX5B_013907 [Scophthalmus maximus]
MLADQAVNLLNCGRRVAPATCDRSVSVLGVCVKDESLFVGRSVALAPGEDFATLTTRVLLCPGARRAVHRLPLAAELSARDLFLPGSLLCNVRPKSHRNLTELATRLPTRVG